MKILRPAFTIIEVLVSVIILSFAIIFVLKIHKENRSQILYISERNKHSLQDSLFLTSNILKYHKDSKTSYDILEKVFRVKELESRKILKSFERDIYIPEVIQIIPPTDQPGPTAMVNEILIKDQYSSSFFRFKIGSF